MKTDTIVPRRNSRAWFQYGKSFFVWSIVFLFILSLFPGLTVSASSESVDFSDQPIPYYSSPSADLATYVAGLPVWSNSTWSYRAVTSSDTADLYCFFVGDIFYFCAEESSKQVSIVRYNGSSYGIDRFNTSASSDYDLFWGSSGSRVSYTDRTIPVFDSLNAGLSAVRDYIDSSGSGGGQTLHELSFTLPAGNVAFIDISGDDFNDMLVSTTLAMPGTGSSLNQTWGYVDSIPSSFTLPISGATSPISWNGVGQATIYGGLRTQFQRYYTVNDSNGKYLVIVNPFYSADYENNLDNLNTISNKILYNSPVLVHVDQAVSYRIFGLNTQLGYQDNEWSIDTTSNGDSWSGIYDDSTGVWGQTNDQTGLAGNPVNGGSNTVVGVENSVTDWLENIAHTISGFFNGAIGAVTTLVNAGSDFFQSVGALYSWLPAPVYSVLISAAILAITIGVIKVFL